MKWHRIPLDNGIGQSLSESISATDFDCPRGGLTFVMEFGITVGNTMRQFVAKGIDYEQRIETVSDLDAFVPYLFDLSLRYKVAEAWRIELAFSMSTWGYHICLVDQSSSDGVELTADDISAWHDSLKHLIECRFDR